MEALHDLGRRWGEAVGAERKDQCRPGDVEVVFYLVLTTFLILPDVSAGLCTTCDQAWRLSKRKSPQDRNLAGFLPWNFLDCMVLAVGIEPTTSCLQGRRSTD